MFFDCFGACVFCVRFVVLGGREGLTLMGGLPHNGKPRLVQPTQVFDEFNTSEFESHLVLFKDSYMEPFKLSDMILGQKMSLEKKPVKCNNMMGGQKNLRV